MSRKKKSILPRIEIIIVLVFFLSFIVWAVSKCNNTKLMYQEQLDLGGEETEEEETASLENADPSDATNAVGSETEAAGTTLNSTQTADQRTGQITSPTTATTPPPPANNTLNNTVQSSGSILYVTIDGLNLRTAPHLDSTIIRKLKLFEEVIFMNEVTDSTQTISLGKEIATEPWVKVKHQRGFIGWVYGAGVNYYKKKRTGVE